MIFNHLLKRKNKTACLPTMSPQALVTTWGSFFSPSYFAMTEHAKPRGPGYPSTPAEVREYREAERHRRIAEYREPEADPTADAVARLKPLARQSFQEQPHLSWVDRVTDVERRAADLGLASTYQARRRAIFHVEEERNGHRHPA
jgi:hypothetical protein